MFYVRSRLQLRMHARINSMYSHTNRKYHSFVFVKCMVSYMSFDCYLKCYHDRVRKWHASTMTHERWKYHKIHHNIYKINKLITFTCRVKIKYKIRMIIINNTLYLAWNVLLIVNSHLPFYVRAQQQHHWFSTSEITLQWNNRNKGAQLVKEYRRRQF